MARRPSGASLMSMRGSSSLLSPSLSEAPLPSITPTRSASLTPSTSIEPQMDSDDLFTKHTIAEVKGIQQRLRADANAKQEELRLMVGERYRDLLQASTSIISIAKSSKRVIEALDETKEAILAQQEPPPPRKAVGLGKQDAHLHALQQLSAHMKLLLDAPEHLWRLIERKKYFPAAWLFLLSRVVHRGLVSEDEENDEHWTAQGIDVIEQFPLVQRQWDAVSQFRAQIIHRSSMSLREYSTPAEDICGTLLGLHFLDSRPLMDTLTVLFTQRSKTLHTLLAKSLEIPSLSPTSPITNGHVPRTAPVREVKAATQSALDAIIRTAEHARAIFEEDPATKRSMISSSLEFIHSDTLPSTRLLPAELQLTTQSLLATLPSSAHFLLLPSGLKKYKPYVDLSSTSVALPQPQFTAKLDEWFTKAMKGLSTALDRWFADLRTAKDVWTIRTSTRSWITAHEAGLTEDKLKEVTELLDDVCRRRMIEIWKVALSDVEGVFALKLQRIVGGEGLYYSELSPMDHLFHAPPQPSVPKSGPVESSLQKYRASLRKQLQGRTTFLDELSTILENCAKALQVDLSHVLSSKDDSTESLVEELKEAYRPNADRLCGKVVKILEASAEKALSEPDTSMKGAMFIGRAAEELSLTSPFISRIGCSEDVATVFRENSKALHDRIIDRWQTDSVAQVLQSYDSYKSNASSPSGPSSTLTNALLSLATSVQEPGLSGDPTRKREMAKRTVRMFTTKLCTSSVWKVIPDAQAAWDLAFLRELAKVWGEKGDWTDAISQRLQAVREEDDEEDVPDEATLTKGSADHLAKTQLLFGPLLPPRTAAAASAATPKSGVDGATSAGDKLSSLLVFGTPVLDQAFQAAVELAKPSSRFGLLLVGTTLAR